jgi:serine/threonine protein kinase
MNDGVTSIRQGAGSHLGTLHNTVIMPDGTKPVPLGSGMITGLLGEGGMANVYEIWNAHLEVHRAVKLINPSACKDSIERFQTEIKITAKLHHPNITEIYSVGEWNGVPYIEMEKLDGETLDRLVNRRGALPVPVGVAIGIMMARALNYAQNHKYVIYGKEYHGIIHRDLKPGNIMICTDGRIKLMDFGIARPADASFHTMGGVVLGTLQYLSPEQLNNESLDLRTDIYSLGVTLYEALTGFQAFPERNMHKLIVDKCTNHYKPLCDFEIVFPPRLRRVLTKCLFHDRMRRIESTEQLCQDLEQIFLELTPDTPEQTLQKFVSAPAAEKVVIASRSSNTGAVAIILTVVAVLILTAGVVGAFRMQTRRDTVTMVLPSQPAQTVLPSMSTTQPQTALPIPADSIKLFKKAVSAPMLRPPVRMQREVTAKILATNALRSKYSTDDIFEIITDRCVSRDWAAALEYLNLLPPESMASPKATIMKMRALHGAGRLDALQQLLSAQPLSDGEYFLFKARMAYEHGDMAAAENELELCLQKPAQYIEYNTLKQSVYFLQALCMSHKFDRDPSETNWNNSSGAWYRLKNQMRTNQAHEYFRKADAELKRISEEYHSRN